MTGASKIQNVYCDLSSTRNQKERRQLEKNASAKEPLQVIKREPSVEIIHGKPIKKLRVDLKGTNDALNFQDDLADLFALKSGTDMLASLVTSQSSKNAAQKSD